MIDTARRTLAILLLILSCSLAAQEATTTEEKEPATTTKEVVVERDSRQTREDLRELLHRLPPDVGKVLKLDPTLWKNESYLSHYPALAAFVASHPDVAHSPSFYLESVWIPSDPPLETPGTRMWSDMFEAIAIFGGFSLGIFVFTWLIRTGIEQRRWSRLSKIQSEVHNKLLDRFASNEDMLNYIQTPAGRRFLESAPIQLEQPARALSAPVGRVLWSVQAGLVILFGGFGLKYIGWSVSKEVAEPMSAMGALGIAVGLGLIFSAAAAYILSRKMGLWQDTASTPESTTASE